MKLNELLQAGDIINSRFHKVHYIVGETILWNRVTESEDGLDYALDYKTIPEWIDSILRNGEDITEQLERRLTTQVFKFGDRVVDRDTPKSDAIFLEYISNEHPLGWARVAYHDSDRTVNVQAAPTSALSHKE